MSNLVMQLISNVWLSSTNRDTIIIRQKTTGTVYLCLCIVAYGLIQFLYAKLGRGLITKVTYWDFNYTIRSDIGWPTDNNQVQFKFHRRKSNIESLTPTLDLTLGNPQVKMEVTRIRIQILQENRKPNIELSTTPLDLGDPCIKFKVTRVPSLYFL